MPRREPMVPGSPESEVALEAQRQRVYTDHHARAEAHSFVVQHFGGDPLRAAAFFEELARNAYIGCWEDDG